MPISRLSVAPFRILNACRRPAGGHRLIPVLALALLVPGRLPAEETFHGSDVAVLLDEAKQGKVDSLIELAEHFIAMPVAEVDDAPSRDFPQLEKWLQAASAKGSAEASSLLGQLYMQGAPGVPANPVRGFNFVRRAADAGYFEAAFLLGYYHRMGLGTAKDAKQAEKWFRYVQEKAGVEHPLYLRAVQQLDELGVIAAEEPAPAAETPAVSVETAPQKPTPPVPSAAAEGAPEAAKLYQRALAFGYGDGVARDLEQAAQLLMAAAQQGHADAQKKLRIFDFYPGMGRAAVLARIKTKEGLAELTAAAEKGDVEAQFALGLHDLIPDPAVKLQWLSKAAAQQHRVAMSWLARAYDKGEGVRRDPVQAHAWHAQAALLGDSQAKLKLAEIYAWGYTGLKSPALAKYWNQQASLGAAADDSTAKYARDAVNSSNVSAAAPDYALKLLRQAAAGAVLPDGKMMVASAPPAPPAPKPAAPATPRQRTSEELRAAAEKGDVAAMYELGRAELDRRQDESNRGSGVVAVDPQRDAYDFRWIMAAARAGHPEAQFLAATHWLSAETDAGKKTWLEKAAAQGHAAAKQRLDADTKAAAVAATQAAEAAKRAAADRELAAKGDADAAFRLLRARIKEIANLVITDFQAEQNGRPTSGKNYKLGYLDAEMIKWNDAIANRLHPDGLVMLHDYLRDERSAFAYHSLLVREWIARIDPRLQLPEGGFGTNSRAGFDKALAYLRGKLPADTRAKMDQRAAEVMAEPWAQNVVGANYESGVCGYPQDYGRAVTHYRAAAEAGYAAGQSNLGRCYYLGLGVPKDLAQARTWYAKAAAQGDATAQSHLKSIESLTPMVRIRGLTAEQRAQLTDDEWVAAEALALDAEQRDKLFAGDPAMTLAVAVNYRDGANGFVQDYGRAFTWLSESARHGNADAMAEIGNFHALGLGRPEDPVVAFQHNLRAAERGSAQGQLNAGFSYLHGDGVASDPLAAHEWLTKAAAQGQAAAQNLLKNLGQDVDFQASLAQRRQARAAQPFQSGAPAASASAYDPLKDNPILQQAALATKALQGDQAAAAAFNAQQQQERSQRALINGTDAAAPADFEESLRRVRSRQDRAALTDLAERLEKGQGVPADPERALALYREAAGDGINRRAELAVVRLQHTLDAAKSAHPAPPVPNAGPMRIPNLLVEAMSAEEKTDQQKMMNAAYRLRNAAEALEREDRMRSFLFTPLELGRKAMSQGNKDEAKAAWFKAAAAGTTAAVAELKKNFPETAVPPPAYQPGGPALWPGAPRWEQAHQRLMEITASWKQNPWSPGQFSDQLDELSQAGLAEAAAFRAHMLRNNYVAVAPVDNPGEVRSAAQRIDNIVEFTNRAIDLGHADSAWLLRQFRYFPGKSREDAMQLALADDQPSADELARAAKNGEVEAQLALAAKLGRTQPDQAVYWLGCAARNGHVAADLAMAGFYAQGQRVPVDSQQAVCWLARAAIKGRQEAQIIFGDYLAGKFGGRAQPAYARFWYERAAAFGRDGDYLAQLARMRAAQIDTAPPRVAAAFAQAKELSGRAIIPELPKKN